MPKIRVLVLAGGQSDEHEVSLTSARSLLRAVEGTDIEATTLVITRAGRWLNPAESQKALTAGRAPAGGELTLHRAHLAEDFDVVFPLIHGPMGEDGTLQGMLELAGIPYVGSGVLASSLCMDKVMSKAVLASHGIPQVRYTLITHHDWLHQRDQATARCADFGPPWFVKPANLGSSVGITRATDAEQLLSGVHLALDHDRRVIVEQALTGARELEVAILGNDEPAASAIGEITYDSDFYDYETKYTDGRAGLHIPAAIPNALANRIKELACRAFKILDCAGLARIDFFFRDDEDALWLNEVNTMPGFTPFSMYPSLWEHEGIAYAELVQKLVALARERHGHKKRAKDS